MNPKFLFKDDIVRHKPPAGYTRSYYGTVTEIVGTRVWIGTDRRRSRNFDVSELQLVRVSPRHIAEYLLRGRPDGFNKTKRWIKGCAPEAVVKKIIARLLHQRYMKNLIMTVGALSYPTTDLVTIAREVYRILNDQISNGYHVAYLVDDQQAA